MTVDIDWDGCYLNDPDCKELKKQIVDDLFTELKKGDSFPDDLVTIDRPDHSTAFEQFIVLTRSLDDYYNLQYYGGGS